MKVKRQYIKGRPKVTRQTLKPGDRVVAVNTARRGVVTAIGETRFLYKAYNGECAGTFGSHDDWRFDHD